MNHIMYVVKSGNEYISDFSRFDDVEWTELITLAKIFRTFSAAVSYADYHGGQVYQVQLIISDTPVQES